MENAEQAINEINIKWFAYIKTLKDPPVIVTVTFDSLMAALGSEARTFNEWVLELKNPQTVLKRMQDRLSYSDLLYAR